MDRHSRLILLWMLSMGINRMMDNIAYFNIKIKRNLVKQPERINKKVFAYWYLLLLGSHCMLYYFTPFLLSPLSTSLSFLILHPSDQI